MSSMDIAGIDWSADRFLPVFQTPEHLTIYDLRGASNEVQLSAATMAGIINRPTPMVYQILTDEDAFWLKELLGGSLFSKVPFLPQFLARPAWLARFLFDGGIPALPNVVIPGQGPMPLIDVSAALASAAVTWEDLQWIREVWSGAIVIKGVLTGDDARRAVDEGASAVVVSNHGGRQLDCVPAALRVLPEIVEAVNGRAEVLMDGGIRRGSDVVKAICLGARAVLIGRAYAYGLAAAGQAGVAALSAIMNLQGHKMQEFFDSWLFACSARVAILR